MLISGEAGGGKSGVLYLTVEAIKKKGWPVLAFRVDRLEPEHDPLKLGEQLRLPESPAYMLAGIAQGQKALLVIDQIDAVSLTSGRHPEFYDTILEIIRQALTYPNLRVLLACRKFDLHNDQRFRELTGERGIADEVEIKRLTDEAVRQALNRLGVSYTDLNEKQLQMLSVPLHLKVFIEGQNTDSLTNSFSTTTELYDKYWDTKRDHLKLRLGEPVKWTKVIDCLCDSMSANQILSVPVVALDVDDLHEDMLAMASEGVLVQDGSRISFFHEGFFDYAFARGFAGRGHRLMDLLTQDEQYLFRRAQVRQILVQKRESNPSQYLKDLHAILHSGNVRFHLQKVVLALLTSFPDPTEEEWKVVAGWLVSDDLYRVYEAWSLPRQSQTWFELVDGMGVLNEGLRQFEGRKLDLLYFVLQAAFTHSSQRVMALLEPFFGTSEEWENRFIYLMRQPGVLPLSRHLFERFLQILEAGKLDHVEDFWMYIDDLPKTQPDWACEAIGAFLRRRVLATERMGNPNPFNHHSFSFSIEEKSLALCAENTPSQFLQATLPVVIEVAQKNVYSTEHWPQKDDIWFAVFSYPSPEDFQLYLIRLIATALQKLASNNRTEFDQTIGYLRSLDIEMAQYLACQGFLSDPTGQANQAIEFLCERPERLGLEDPWGTSQVVPQALREVTPYCSDKHLARLELAVLNFYPYWERPTKHSYNLGQSQLPLIEGITATRRSPAIRRRLQELKRRFPIYQGKQNFRVRVGTVESPISKGSVEKMKDRHWLGAMVKYRHEEDPFRKVDSLIGGARQLARLLEEETTRDPQRFAKLIVEMPNESHRAYFEAILRGIGKSRVEVPLLVHVSHYCHAFPDHPFGKDICDSLKGRGEDNLPNEALEMIAWYALNDPDPQRETWDTPTSGGGSESHDRIFSAGINCTRGIAAMSIAELLFDGLPTDGERYFEYFRLTIERLVTDPSVAVRSCAAESLVAALNYDRDWAVDQFLKLCETRDELLGTSGVERFLGYASYTHYPKIEPLLERMLKSGHSRTKLVGSRRVCLAALGLDSPNAQSLAEQCLSGTVEMRLGAAEIFSANIDKADLQSYCEASLLRLFHDEDDKVRKEASTCFTELWEVGFGGYEPLIKAFVGSPAFADHHSFLISGQERTSTRLPKVVCLVGERLLDVAGESANDIRTSIAGDAYHLGEIVVRLYSQSNDPTILSQCLDLMDRMAKLQIYDFDKLLASYDR